MTDLPEALISHKWERLADLPSDWRTLGHPELDRELTLWLAEKNSLKDQEKVERLYEELSRRWAIETGLLERLYTIDRGTTETFVKLGLEAITAFTSDRSNSRDALKLIADQQAALDFVFSYIKDERPLGTSFIKELHQLLTRNQLHRDAVDQFGHRFQTNLIRGDWKKLANNPRTANGTIHEYCPPEFVADEMDLLIRLHQEHEELPVRPEVEAAWLHHRFTQIHPFEDGNGRVARALATMVFLKGGFLPLVIRSEEHRDAYLNALESADRGDLSELVNLFTNVETTDTEDAITFIRSLRGAGISEVARSAADAVKRRRNQDERNVATTTERLVAIARNRLTEVAIELKTVFSESGLLLDTLVESDRPESNKWWNQQIGSAAKNYQYFADLSMDRHWVRLRLRAPSVLLPAWNVVVSFHHKESRSGLMAAVVFLTTTEQEFEEGRPAALGSQREFAYSSASASVQDEFRKWLEPAITQALETWQARI